MIHEHPSPCLICGHRPLLNDDGSFVDVVYAYQRIDGKLRLADQKLVLGEPLYWIHEDC